MLNLRSDAGLYGQSGHVKFLTINNMNNLKKLQKYHSMQFEFLRNLVEQAVIDWAIWKENPLYKGYIRNKKHEEKLLTNLM